MTFKYADRVKDTSSSQSSSTITLSGSPPTGFQSFNAGIGNANACVYCVTDGSGNWEINYGVYTNSGTTLGRASTPIASSNSGAQVATFSGTPTVFVDDPAAALMETAWGLPSGRGYTVAFSSSVGASALTANQVIYVPIFIRQAFTSVVIHFNVTIVGSSTAAVDVGIYNNANGAPNAKLGAQTGIAVGSSNGGATGDNATSTINVSPQMPGLYWIGIVGGNPTVTTISSTTGRDVVGATAATDSSSVKQAWAESGTTLPTNANATTSSTTGQGVPYFVVFAS